MTTIDRPKLQIRRAEFTDIPEIKALVERSYQDVPAYNADQLRGQIANFPDGQFVAEYESKIVGYCATFRITEELAFRAHTWKDITGNGYAARHVPTGEFLYGMEICVDPAYRGLRLGQRLYSARRKLCTDLGLRGVVFAGRLPGLARRIAQYESAQAYVDAVVSGRQRDQVLTFQLRNGFQVIGVLTDYLPSDKPSLGYATHLVWWNPRAVQSRRTGRSAAASAPTQPEMVRVAAVQFQQRAVGSFEEFAQSVEYFVDVVGDYKADFVVFPELFTLQLLSMHPNDTPPSDAIVELASYADRLKDLLSRLAVSYNVNIIGGSHPVRTDDGRITNVCFVCLRDGAVYRQGKLHPTPSERFWWKIEGVADLEVIPTDCGPIGVLICYDCEFPELPRHLVDQGAQILFVPFLTDTREAYLRVRYCAQARAVENQCFVALAGNVGNLPKVENSDIHYAQSCILTPCDFVFARDGIAADTTPNVEMVAIADLNLITLNQARRSGTVRNLDDRRFDLYSVTWNKS